MGGKCSPGNTPGSTSGDCRFESGPALQGQHDPVTIFLPCKRGGGVGHPRRVIPSEQLGVSAASHGVLVPVFFSLYLPEGERSVSPQKVGPIPASPGAELGAAPLRPRQTGPGRGQRMAPAKSPDICRCRTMAVRQLPKLDTRVRSPSSAPNPKADRAQGLAASLEVVCPSAGAYSMATGGRTSSVGESCSVPGSSPGCVKAVRPVP